MANIPIPYDSIDYTRIVTTFIWCGVFLIAYFYLVNIVYKMNTNNTDVNRGKKGGIRILASGFTVAWVAMQTAYARSTLDTTWLGMHIELFVPVNIILFLGMIGLNIVVGGTYITNWLKGKQDATSGNE